jgi:hypothetical protein
MDCKAEKCGLERALQRRKGSDPTLTGSGYRRMKFTVLIPKYCNNLHAGAMQFNACK